MAAASTRKASAKKSAGTKPPAKKAPVKKAAGKKAPVKKAAGKKAPVKKAAGKKAPVKTAAAKKAAGKTALVKKAAGKKAPVKKAAGKTAPLKKAPVRKAAAKKAAPKKAAPKKAAPKKVPATKAALTKAAAPAATSRTTTAPKGSAVKAPTPKAPVKKAPPPPAPRRPLTERERADELGVPAPRGVSKDAISYTKDFDVTFLRSQREKLFEARAALLGQAANLEDEAHALIEEAEMGDVQFDDEGGEGDTMAVERERDLALSAQARQTVAEIDAALARIELGTYGYSMVSGRPIPRERLDALPWATELVAEKVGGIGRR